MSSKPISVLRAEALRATGMDRQRLLAEVKRRLVKHRDYCRKSNKKSLAIRNLGRAALAVLQDSLASDPHGLDSRGHVARVLIEVARNEGLI